jgi:type I restriction enzyme S subunit
MTWERVSLKEVGKWFGGATPSKAEGAFWTNGTIPWLSPKDMGPDVLSGTKDQITPAAIQGSSVKLVHAGSVAVVVRSGIIERTLPVSLVPFATTLNQDMKAVEPRPDIDPRWIAWALRAFESELLRDTRKSGTTVASIEWPRFLAFEIPVPSLQEQHEILGVLEDHLSRLRAADASVSRCNRRLAALRDATLYAAVERARESRGVETYMLGDMAKVSSGMTPLKGNRSFYDGGAIPWITSGDLHQGVISEATHFVAQKALEETSLKLVPAGTLLIAMYGEGKTRGTAAELQIEAATNQACAAVQLHDATLRPWVRLVLDANYSKLRRLAAGGVQPNLNLSIIKSIEVPVPASTVRDEILRLRDESEDANSRLRQELSAASGRATNLRRSLLSAAFSGRLTAASPELSEVDRFEYREPEIPIHSLLGPSEVWPIGEEFAREVLT